MSRRITEVAAIWRRCLDALPRRVGADGTVVRATFTEENLDRSRANICAPPPALRTEERADDLRARRRSTGRDAHHHRGA